MKDAPGDGVGASDAVRGNWLAERGTTG